MPENYKERAEECYKNADYSKYLENAKKQYELTKSDEDKEYYDKARSNYEISLEVKEIINSDHEDYYGILGVSEDSTIEEIKKAFRAKAFKFHPDKLKINGAVEAMRIIQKAYFEINTEDKKAAYDAKRRVPKFFRNAVSNGYRGQSDYDQDFMRPFFMYSSSAPGFGFSTSYGGFEYFGPSGGYRFSPDEIYRHIYRHAARPRQRPDIQSLTVTYTLYLVAMLFIILALI